MRKTLILLILLASFSGGSQNFLFPSIPDTIEDGNGRLEFFILHYWDNYNFENPYIFIEGDIMLEYFAYLKDVPYTISNESIFQTLNNASRNNQIFSLFIDTYRIYLMTPDSYFCDYERYLAVAEFVLANVRIPESKKSDFLLEKKIISTNRIGDVATNFVVMDKNNNPVELYNIKSDYVLLFFHNPNCSICVENKEKLSNSETINKMIDNGKLTMFSVCPYDEYELWSNTSYPKKWLNGFDRDGEINKEKLYYFLESSSLYLLDKDKRVLKKDIRLDLLEDYLLHVAD